jgi:large subunit ribosomal protein L13
MNAKTYAVRESEIERRWYVVDATDQTLGRLASRIARVLEGKHKPTYAPNLDTGDHVIVTNAARIAVTSDKLETKLYIRHSGYPQGLKQETLGHLLARRPEEVIRRAVKGMLPRTRLGAQQLRKLKVYAGPDHPHAAQKPEPLEVEA